MPEFIQTDNFADLFRNQTPLIDVRAPIEFEKGSIPGATNLPLLNNQQREQIGKIYRKLGKSNAIELGHTLISGRVKESRLLAWKNFLQNNVNPILYCYRGGLRSEIVQSWLHDAGIDIPIINGGYKALRHFLIDTLEKIPKTTNLIVIGGKTGTAKTQLINSLTNAIDLEGLANHRGSSFGGRINPQPSQATFENQIASQYIFNNLSGQKRFFLEDESRAIGSLSLPLNLFEFMRSSPIAVIESTFEDRIETILRDYIISNYNEYESDNPKNAGLIFNRYLLDSLERIRKRLGNQHYKDIKRKMDQASSDKLTDLSKNIHRDWIHILLQKYYDPMYEYQLERKESRVVFRGSHNEFNEWTHELTKSHIRFQ